MTITTPAALATVDASYDAGFAAWACILNGQAHVRTGPAISSTHAELHAAHLAIQHAPCGDLDLRTDCEATRHHLTAGTDLAQPLLREALHRDVLVHVTLVPRAEVAPAHHLAYTTFQRKQRGGTLARTVTGSFALPQAGGATLELPDLRLTLHEPLTAPLAQVGLILLASACRKLPPNTALCVTGVPASVRELWEHPGRPWHPCPAFVQSARLQLHDQGGGLDFAEAPA